MTSSYTMNGNSSNARKRKCGGWCNVRTPPVISVYRTRLGVRATVGVVGLGWVIRRSTDGVGAPVRNAE
jgi:hypothetical protein